MKLSLSQAAREAGKSKSRISEAIQKGSLSATKVKNRYEIDPAELFRVFPREKEKNRSETVYKTDPERPSETEKDVEIRMLREMLDAKDKHISDLKALLPAPSTKRKFWGLFG